MIGYITIGATDVEAALPFFDAVFGAMGGERKSFEGGWGFYGAKGGDGDVGVCKPFDGQPARGGNGIMIAFTAAFAGRRARDTRRRARQRRRPTKARPACARRTARLLRRLPPRPHRQQVLRLPHVVTWAPRPHGVSGQS